MRARGLIALLALLLLGGCGSDDNGNAGSARSVLERASRTPAKSADVDLSMQLKLDGVEQLKEPIELRVRGPFRSNGAKALPDLDLRVHFEAASRKGDFRLITVRDNAFVEYGGSTYEVGRELVRRYMRQAGSAKQQEQIRKLGISGSNWLKDGKLEDDGRKVSGKLDVRKLLADVNRILAEVPQGRRLPDHTIDQLDDAVKDASLEATVGADHVLRTSRFEVSFELPADLRADARGLKGGRLEFELAQSNVNGDQRVRAPNRARPLTELLRGLGVPPEALLGPGFKTPAPG